MSRTKNGAMRSTAPQQFHERRSVYGSNRSPLPTDSDRISDGSDSGTASRSTRLHARHRAPERASTAPKAPWVPGVRGHTRGAPSPRARADNVCWASRDGIDKTRSHPGVPIIVQRRVLGIPAAPYHGVVRHQTTQKEVVSWPSRALAVVVSRLRLFHGPAGPSAPRSAPLTCGLLLCGHAQRRA